MKFTRRIIAAALLCGALASAPTHIASAVDTFDDNQVPIENRAMNGSLHIYSDESTDEEPSMLTSKAFTNFCTSADSGDCAGQSGLQFIAHLPRCDSTETTDCIVSLTATPKSGSESSATFDRYFPNTGPQSFTGKPSIKLPTGRAPSVWKIPSAPHIGGDEYAVVAKLRGSTDRRSAASFQIVLTPVSLKANADTSNTYEQPHWTSPGRGASPASDRGLFRCAYWGENGACLLSHSFPADFSYSVTIRLAAEPAGWLHGRINNPNISFTKEGDNTLVKVTAAPVQVPAFQVGKMHLEYPADVQKAFGVNGPYGNGGSRQGNQDLADPTLRNAEYNIIPYKDQAFEQLALVTSVIEDKAGWAPWMWRVRTLSDGEMTKAGKCLTTGEGVKGIVTTNATVYGSGPPAFNTETGTLDYKVAAPHFTRTGEVFQGSYNLIMRSDVARCFYNFTTAPVKADISVVEASGTAGKATTSVSEADGWLKLSASGFSHSAPTVRAKLTQDAVVTPSTPAISTTLAMNAKAKKSISSATLARIAKISVPKKAKISLSVSAKYAKTCKASAGTVRTIKKGTCVVKVTVTTAAKKKTSKNVTITVK